nr:hypothetical protein CFP56_08884 [Quercus suber]
MKTVSYRFEGFSWKYVCKLNGNELPEMASKLSERTFSTCDSTLTCAPPFLREIPLTQLQSSQREAIDNLCPRTDR